VIKWHSLNSSHVKKLNARKNIGTFPNCNTANSNCNSPSKTISGITKATLHIVAKDISIVDVKKWEEKIMDEPVDPVTEGFKILITEI